MHEQKVFSDNIEEVAHRCMQALCRLSSTFNNRLGKTEKELIWPFGQLHLMGVGNKRSYRDRNQWFVDAGGVLGLSC